MPSSPSAQGHSPKRPQGSWKMVPMLTRTERRTSGSQQVGESSIASTPRAAALRTAAPTFVASVTPSSTATRRAAGSASRTSAALLSAGRLKAASTPRVTL